MREIMLRFNGFCRRSTEKTDNMQVDEKEPLSLVDAVSGFFLNPTQNL